MEEAVEEPKSTSIGFKFKKQKRCLPWNTDVLKDRFTPQLYQIELLKLSLNSNLLLFIRSDEYKNYLIIMLMKEYEQVLNNLNKNRINTKKIFILVNYQLSINKYNDLIKQHTNLKIKNLNLIQLLQYHEETSGEVIIINIQVFNEWLNKSYIKIDDILLIIFDDIHNIFYNLNNKIIYENILSKITTSPQQQRHIIGFGTLILDEQQQQSTIVKDLDENLKYLKGIFNCNIEFATDLLNTQNLLNGIKNVEQIEVCDENENDEFSTHLLNLLNETLLYINDLNLVEYKKLNKLSADIDCVYIICLKCINECVYMLNTIGIWCLTKSLLPILCQLDKLTHYLVSSQTPHYEFILLLQYITSKLRLLRELCIKQIIQMKHKSANKTEFNEILINKFSTSKVKHLIQILRNYKNNQFCCLVYVKNKQVAITLSLLLKKLSKEDARLSYLSPNYVINSQTAVLNEENNISLDETNLSSSTSNAVNGDFLKQEEILRKFHSGDINLLICTFDMEEYIDVPQSCNLIVRFDSDYFNYYSYILSKTRLKSSKSENKIVYICQQSQLSEFLKKFKNIKQLEFLLESKYSILIKKLSIFNKEEGDEDAEGSNEIYYPNESIKTVSINYKNSIELLNRYCIRLPSDALTQLTANYKLFKNKNGEYKCKLILPINSCLRGIQFESDWHRSISKSFKSIAYSICCKLVDLNELSESLEPITKEYFYKQQLQTLFSDKYLINETSLEETSSPPALNSDDHQPKLKLNNKTKQHQQQQQQTRIGSSKRKQIYKKKISNFLLQSSFDTQHPTYLYRFKCALTTPLNTIPMPVKQTQTEKYFAIITQKRLLEIPDYTIFTQYGEESICVDLIKDNFYMTQNQIKLIKNFHKFLFSYVLRMERPPVVYQPDSTGSFICLVTQQHHSFEIDWQLMRLVENYNDKSFIKPIIEQKPAASTTTTATEDEDVVFIFKQDLYTDAVIIPYYRYNDYQPQFYCVQSIDTSLNPQSKFPSNNVLYQTFYDYYAIKYNKIIKNQSQPMLVVQHPSTRLNLLTPRYMNLKASVLQKSVFFTNTTAAATTSNDGNQTTIIKSNKIYLVPELVNIHPFSCTLWKRCLSLPSILYRLNSLLICEELRRDIAQSTNVGVPWIENDFKFEKLEFNWDFKKEIEISHVPDQEFEMNGKNQMIPNSDVIDESWNFEISEWTNVSAFNSNQQQNCNKNGWFENFDQNKTLFLDTNDLAMFEDEYYEEEDEEDKDGNNSIDDDDDEEENKEEEEEKPKKQKNNENKFTINLNNLKADLKSKSAKLLSKLNVSNKELKSFIIGSTGGGGGESVVDGIDEAGEMNEDLIKFFNETQIMYLKQKQLNFDSLSSSSSTLTPTTGTLDDLVENENEYGNWLNNVDVNFNGESPVLSESIFKLIENLKFLKLKLKNEKNEANVDDGDFDFNYEDCFINRLNSFFDDQQKVVEVDEEESFGIINQTALNIKFNFNLDHDDYSAENSDQEDVNCGPGPSLLLQALTLSNASDGFNLERLETIGDSFLKKAITVYLFGIYTNVNEGKLSYLRSKQVSNYNLYKLGKRRNIHEIIHANKFEPFDTWLPLHYDSVYSNNLSFDQLFAAAFHKLAAKNTPTTQPPPPPPTVPAPSSQQQTTFDKYKMHIVSDKSIADSVEAIIGAYLIKSGPKAALRVMYWFGLKVLPKVKLDDGSEVHIDLAIPCRPEISNYKKLDYLLSGYENFENIIGYRFKTRAYLLQAFTHASYVFNDVTDCYQRLEFLGDAILDYVITRHLYEDPKKHSPGELTDLRSALVNNNIFSYLAVKYEFYKYFRYLSPQLFPIIDNFIKNYKKFNDNDLDENFLFNHSSLEGDEEDDDLEFLDYVEQPLSKQQMADNEQTSSSNNEFEELEVPKVLGDIFESVAGAIFLDSNKSLETVWKVYYTLMKPYIEKYTAKVPKSPIRELLELEPETAKFEKPERTIDGKIRVTVNVFGKGKFKGIGRNYRIAKNAAAKLALKYIRKQENVEEK